MPEPAPAATLEARVSTFDLFGRSIDDLVETVKEIPNVAKKVAHYTYYTAKAALGLAAGVTIAGASALVGAPLSIATATNVLNAGYHALIFPVGMATGRVIGNWKNKVKTTYKQVMNDFAIGGILGGLLHYVFLGSNKLGAIAAQKYGYGASLAVRAGAAVAQIPPFLTAHEWLKRALDKDHEAKPLSNIWKLITGPLKWLIIPLMLNFTVVPDYLGPQYQMAGAAGIAGTYGTMISEPKKEIEKKQPGEIDYNQLAKAMQQQAKATQQQQYGAPKPTG